MAEKARLQVKTGEEVEAWENVGFGSSDKDVPVTLNGEEIVLEDASGTNGNKVTVGTSAVEMTFTGTTKSLSIQSDHDNAGKVWFGLSNVDDAGANAFGRLAPGQSVTLDLNDSSVAIYAVSDTAAQTVYKVCLT